MPDDPMSDVTVVFDVDDTVYLERDYVASGFAALQPVVQERLGVGGFAATAWRHFLSGHRGNIFDLTLTELGASYGPEEIKKLVADYRTHTPRISLLPDALIALAHLRGCGVHIGVLTDGPAASQTRKVAALGLGDMAEVVVVTDEYGPGYSKPHLRGFEEVANCIHGAHFVYVADNPLKDFVAPKALGWSTIRVRRSKGLHESVESGNDVDDICTGLENLSEIVIRLALGHEQK